MVVFVSDEAGPPSGNIPRGAGREKKAMGVGGGCGGAVRRRVGSGRIGELPDGHRGRRGEPGFLRLWIRGLRVRDRQIRRHDRPVHGVSQCRRHDRHPLALQSPAAVRRQRRGDHPVGGVRQFHLQCAEQRREQRESADHLGELVRRRPLRQLDGQRPADRSPDRHNDGEWCLRSGERPGGHRPLEERHQPQHGGRPELLDSHAERVVQGCQLRSDEGGHRRVLGLRHPERLCPGQQHREYPQPGELSDGGRLFGDAVERVRWEPVLSHRRRRVFGERQPLRHV